MLKNGKKLTDKVEKKNGYYLINDSELVLLLESVEKFVIDEILSLKPQKVIALDKFFNGNDQLKPILYCNFEMQGKSSRVYEDLYQDADRLYHFQS